MDTRDTTQEATMDQDQIEEMIETRRGKCEACGCDGVHVDTTAGEIVVECRPVATVPASETYLMVDADGRLVCDDCAAD